MNNKNLPFVFCDSIEFIEVEPGIKRKILAYGDDMMQVEVHFDQGSVGAMHSHKHTQLTYVLSGVFEFTINGETKIVKKGDTLYKESNVMHGCVCLESGALLDTFNPYRQDFLDSK